MGLQIKVSEIQLLMSFLNTLPIPAKKSRFRTRLIKLAQERLDQYNQERDNLVQELAEKDEEGKVKQGDPPGTIIIPDNKRQEFNEAMEDLINEVWELEETDETKKMLDVVREAIEKFDEEVKGDESLAFDRWCELLDIE